MSTQLSIGKLSAATGVPTKTIRYYEASKLLSEAKRGDNGYRVYDEQDVRLLLFIKRARDLGFSLTQVRELVALWGDKGRKSREVKQLTKGHLKEIEAKIDALKQLRADLSSLVEHCHGDDRPDCSILENLAAARGIAPDPDASESSRADLGCSG